MIGGSANERLPESSSRIVTGINVGTGFLSRAEPTSGPAVASSQHMIVDDHLTVLLPQNVRSTQLLRLRTSYASG